jgi:hypothetical protein
MPLSAHAQLTRLLARMHPAQATPTAETAMFYFQTNTLGFTPEFLGRVRLAGSLASLAGVGLYNFCLKDVPLRRMFLWTSLLGAGLGLTQVLLITGARARSPSCLQENFFWEE